MTGASTLPSRRLLPLLLLLCRVPKSGVWGLSEVSLLVLTISWYLFPLFREEEDELADLSALLVMVVRQVVDALPAQMDARRASDMESRFCDAMVPTLEAVLATQPLDPNTRGAAGAA